MSGKEYPMIDFANLDYSCYLCGQLNFKCRRVALVVGCEGRWRDLRKGYGYSDYRTCGDRQPDWPKHGISYGESGYRSRSSVA